jgi:uracil-DNA glycosylase
MQQASCYFRKSSQHSKWLQIEERPFVGSAVKMFDKKLKDATIDRSRVYVTNAVKYFKFLAGRTFRLHQKPDILEIKSIPSIAGSGN